MTATTSKTRQQVGEELKKLNAKLKAAHDSLDSERYDPDVVAISQQLREFGQQIRHAVKLYNQGDTAGAERAMPSRVAVKDICRQAADLKSFDNHPDSDNQSESGGEPPRPASPAAPADPTTVDQETAAGDDEDQPKPTERPTTSRELRAPEPVSNDALLDALYEYSSDKENPLTVYDLAEAARIANAVSKRRRPSKRPPHMQPHHSHRDH